MTFHISTIAKIVIIFDQFPIYLLLIVSHPTYIWGEGPQAENSVWKRNHDNLALTFKTAILFCRILQSKLYRFLVKNRTVFQKN